MGIFNEQSFDHPFAKGIQGAPGVGFSLTADGNYDMNKKKLTNVGAPSNNTDAATKKYVDDNSSGSPTTTRLTVDSNIDMKDRYRILNLKHPVDSDEPATKQYSDSRFLDRNGSRTMIGNLSMNNNKIIKVGTPTANDDVATKKYVDDKSSGSLTSTRLTVDSNIDMKNTYRITNLKTPLDGKEPPTKDYVDNTFLDRDGSYPMKGNLNMDNNRIFNLPAPNGGNQPTPLAFTDLKYVARDGSSTMTNNLNMDNKKIINLRPPTSNTDAATKKYVDDNTGTPDLSDYLEKDGTVTMTGNLNVGNNKIINLGKPTQDNDAVNKNYADKLVHHTAVQPSHYNNQFAYLMTASDQWTDEIDGGNSFNLTKIDNLPPSKGNFHDYNHKVLYTTIYKNSQGGYKYKMGINFYRLAANTDYTLCLEMLNTDYQLWHKSKITVDRGTSTGLSIGNESIRKLSHRYTQSNGQPAFMYYYRIIVNFRKLSTGNKFFLHILVDIPQVGTDLASYPKQFSGVYIITYGIVGTFSNIDPDKVYDYHTAFDIKPTEVVYNVDINANDKEIKNIKLDRQNDNSAATVALVKEVAPFTKNALYRLYFSEVYDFANADSYKLSSTASGIVFNNLSSSSGNTLSDMGIPTKTIDDIRKEGLNVSGYTIGFSPPIGITKYTLCIVFYHWRNRNFSIKKKDSNSGATLLNLFYTTTGNIVSLVVNNVRREFTMLSSFNGQKIVIWLTENFNSNITKVKISNYSAILSLQTVRYTREQVFEFSTKGGVLSKIMYSPNFYDTDSEQYHKVMLQEKLNGSYIM